MKLGLHGGRAAHGRVTNAEPNMEPYAREPRGTSGDALRTYFSRLGQVPLLTREEEVEAATRIERAELGIAHALVCSRGGGVADGENPSEQCAVAAEV
jgi:hypothetical protein